MRAEQQDLQQDLRQPLLQEHRRRKPQQSTETVSEEGGMQQQRRASKGHPAWALPTELSCIVVLVTIAGTSAYTFHQFAGGLWTFTEAFYFALVTLTTVGYGDYLPPKGRAGKLLVVVFIWWNAFVSNIILGHFGKSLERRIDLMGRPLGKALGSRQVGATLIRLVVLSALMTSFAVSFCYQEDRPAAEGLFFGTVTLTTVGYGHLTPSSFRRVAGPFLVFGVAAWGNLTGYFAEALQQRVSRRLRLSSRRSPAPITVMLTAGLVIMAAFAFYAVTSQGWTLQECFYFVTVTITTVGFGDYIPFGTPEEMWLTMVFIWVVTLLLPLTLGTLGGEVVRAFEELVAAMLMDKPQPSAISAEKALRRGVRRVVHLFLLAFIVLCGAMVFAYLESWSFVEGIYFVTVTLATVGYGDMCPSLPLTRGLAIFYLLIGVPTVAALVDHLSSAYTNSLLRMVRRPQ